MKCRTFSEASPALAVSQLMSSREQILVALFHHQFVEGEAGALAEEH